MRTYSIHKSVNNKLKPNEKEKIKVKCKKKNFPWLNFRSIDGNTGYQCQDIFPIHVYCKRTRKKLCTPIWISKKHKKIITSESTIKLHEIRSFLRKGYDSYVSKTRRRKTKQIVMNEHLGNFRGVYYVV